MPRRRGRRGVVGTMATTAVVVGTAKSVSNAMDGKKNAAQQPAPAPAPAPAPVPAAAPGGDMMAQLQQLGDLHTAGVLTDEEFAAAKAKILG